LNGLSVASPLSGVGNDVTTLPLRNAMKPPDRFVGGGHVLIGGSDQHDVLMEDVRRHQHDQPFRLSVDKQIELASLDRVGG
jgi:hypothetical protein